MKVTSQTSALEPAKCVECGGPLAETFADVVCTHCGLVHRCRYVEPPIALLDRAYPSRGAVYVAHANRPNIVDDLGSFIGPSCPGGFRDSRGRRLPPSSQVQFHRQKNLNDREVHTQGKKRQYRALRQLNNLAGVLELAEATKADAAQLFRQTEAQLKRRVYIAEMVAGAVYLAVRTNPDENLRVNALVEACANAGLHVRQNKVLQAAAQIRKLTGRPLRVLTPRDYFEPVFNKIIHHPAVHTRLQALRLPLAAYRPALRGLTAQLLSRVTANRKGGRDPYTLTCAAFLGADILLAWTQRHRKTGLVSQKQMAQICDVKPFTLIDHYLKVIKPLLKVLAPEGRIPGCPGE